MKGKKMGRILCAVLAAVLTVGVCLAAQSEETADGVQWLAGSITGWAESEDGKWMYYVNGEPAKGLRTDLPGYEGEAFVFDTDGTLITTSLGEGWTPRDTGSAGSTLPGQEDASFPGGESLGGGLSGLGSMFGGGNFWRTMAVVELVIIVVLLVKPEKKETGAETAESAEETPPAEE